VSVLSSSSLPAAAPAPGFVPAWVEIDLDTIAYNFNLVRNQVGPNTLIFQAVKSDAYGHGLVPVSRRLIAEGADGLCVARLWEAKELRQNGIAAPIFCLTSVFPEESAEAVALDLEVMVCRREPAEALSQAAMASGRRVRVHLKVDCGMGRLGVAPEDVVEFARFLGGLKGLEVRGLMSHLSNADDDEDAVTREQIAVYEGVANALRERDLLPPVCHQANSDGTMRFLAARRNMVRQGIATYGCYPSAWYKRNFELRPAKSVRARLISVRRFPPGKGLSYSQEFKTRRESLIGVAPVGYADGYLRALKTKTCMLVRGARVPVVGRICMEQSLLDLTDLPRAEYGDIVTILGSDGAERITAEDLASWAGTINYEIVTRLGCQYPRFHLSGGEWKQEGDEKRSIE